MGDYVTDYGFPADTEPTGTYARKYDATPVAPWLWNAEKKVFLSTEDEQAVAAKADYVVAKGIGTHQWKAEWWRRARSPAPPVTGGPGMTSGPAEPSPEPPRGDRFAPGHRRALRCPGLTRRCEQLVLGRVPGGEQRAAQHRRAAQPAGPDLGAQR